MKIRCWGSRGSISVSGRDYIKYGGDTSCVEVVGRSGDTIILDAGTGIRALGNELIRQKRLRLNLLLTHSHWDHLAGFPFFKPIYRKDSVVRVYGPLPSQDSLRSILSKTMAAPYFPVELKDISASITFLGMGNRNYSVGSVRVRTVPTSHPNEGVGYRIEEDGRSFVYMTDNELTFHHPNGLKYEEYVEFCRGADLLFHDAEFRRSEYKRTIGWGHSVYLDTLKLAMDAGVRTLGLFHHNQDRTDKEVDGIVRECREAVRKKGVRMKVFAVAAGTKVEL